MTARNQALLEQALMRLRDNPAPRLDRLYADARAAWMGSGRGRFEVVAPLLTALRQRREELTAEEDAALRQRYGLGVGK